MIDAKSTEGDDVNVKLNLHNETAFSEPDDSLLN